MKRYLHWLGAAISIACAIYFAIAVSNHWQFLASTHWGYNTFLSLVLALLLYILTYALASRAWQLSLAATGKTVGFREAAQILMLSQFAKYLPGNFGHHVGRVILGKRAGLPAEAVLASIVVDTLAVILAAVACSLPTVPLLLDVLEERNFSAIRTVGLAISLGLSLTVFVLVIPITRRALAAALRNIRASNMSHRLGFFFRAGAWHCISFLIGAIALYLLCESISGSALALPDHAMSIVGVYATAWLLGFIMPGAPAGLGVREFTLLLGLSPLIGEQNATAATTMLRVITTVGDGLVFLIAIGYKRAQANVYRERHD